MPALTMLASPTTPGAGRALMQTTGWAGCFALAAYRAGWLPRWLMLLGIAAPTLRTLYLLGTFLLPLQTAAVGAPLGLVWYLATGIVLLRAARQAPARETWAQHEHPSENKEGSR